MIQAIQNYQQKKPSKPLTVVPIITSPTIWDEHDRDELLMLCEFRDLMLFIIDSLKIMNFVC